jgi:O-antigen ligase
MILLMLPRLQTLRSFQRFDTISTELTQGDLNNRTNNWRDGFDTFLEHPFLGVGGNKYRSVNDLYHVAHNSYLSVLVEHGLIGFVLFAGILMISVINAIRQPKRDAMFWLTVLLVWALGAFTLTWEDRKSTWLLLSLLTASAALAQPPTENAATSAPIAFQRRTQGTRKDVSVAPSKQVLSVQMRPAPTTGKGRAANRKT